MKKIVLVIIAIMLLMVSSACALKNDPVEQNNPAEQSEPANRSDLVKQNNPVEQSEPAKRSDLVKQNNSVEQNDGVKASFEIYLVNVNESSGPLNKDLNKDLNKLKLEEPPVLTDKNISEYIWDKHQIKLIKDDELNKVFEEKLNLKIPVGGKRFVVVCNGERIYCGMFWSMLSSAWPPEECPIINSFFGDSDYFNIYFQGKNDVEGKNDVQGEDDVRSDKRIYETLKKLGKLK